LQNAPAHDDSPTRHATLDPAVIDPAHFNAKASIAYRSNLRNPHYVLRTGAWLADARRYQ
jgi:hypothetical protein